MELVDFLKHLLPIKILCHVKRNIKIEEDFGKSNKMLKYILSHFLRRKLFML
jgi:hypothetical protein